MGLLAFTTMPLSGWTLIPLAAALYVFGMTDLIQNYKTKLERTAATISLYVITFITIYAIMTTMIGYAPRMFCFPVITGFMQFFSLGITFTSISGSFAWFISSIFPGRIKAQNVILGLAFIGITVVSWLAIMKLADAGFGLNCLFAQCEGLICR
jgi:hypothetical protein